MNTDKAINKATELIDKLQKSEDFEEIHEECLNFCKIVWQKKSDYKSIDIPYPEELKIRITNFSDNKVKKVIDA
ncbi:hypothetical protein HY463_01150, partial [Candidatus Peregrinibacteria bacterium]|nr:hypothetical protein [Candidatus Peregrinibacteria bacterium]